MVTFEQTSRRGGGNSKYRGLRGKIGSEIRALREKRGGRDSKQPCRWFCKDFSFASKTGKTLKADS